MTTSTLFATSDYTLSALLVVALAVIAFLSVYIVRQRKELSHKRFHAQKDGEMRLNLYNNISRSLRVPLNAINESCKTLNEKGVSQLSEAEYQALISNIHANSHEMFTYVDELREVGSFCGSVPLLSMIEVDLAELVMSYRREILHETHRGVVVGIHTDVSPDCMATLNTPMFHQLIMHLLRVCAHRTKEGHITISYKQENGGLRFLIEDTGGSVPVKFKNVIFKDVDYASFVIPGDDLSKAISLNICKTIIESMHGTIEAIYKKEGIVFDFWFPCRLRFD